MTSTNANDFKKYFFDKFVIVFNELLTFSFDNVKDDATRKELGKVKNIIDKLNHEKIISKLVTKNTIYEKLTFLHRNEYKKEHMEKLMKEEKEFLLMPSFNLVHILKNISKSKRNEFYDKVNDMFLCISSYNQIMVTANSQKDGEEFNPFSGIGMSNVTENMDITTMFDGVKTEQYSAYEMLMKSLVDQQMDGKMTEYMDNINEKDVDSAAGKISNVLDSDKFKGQGQTTNILKNMLGKIKKEVVNMGNDKSNNGKQGVEKLLGIAQTVASDMATDIKSNKVSVLDLWDATAKLAEDTTNSTAFQVLNKIVRTNIEKNLTKDVTQTSDGTK